MGLYNTIFGVNDLAPLLLAMLELDPRNQGQWPVGRFRDAFLAPDGAAIHLYTRNGGGNREHYNVDGTPPGLGCRCPGCCIAHHLPRHPNYLRDVDDDFDCTYATVIFSVPAAYAEDLKQLAAAGHGVATPPSERWKTLIADLEHGTDSSRPEIARARQVGEEIIGKLKKALDLE